MEKRQYTMVPASALAVNEGQIAGLPRNPRLIRDARYEKLKRSLAESPEFMQLRPLIAVSQGDGRPAVVICGNMRLRACIDLGWEEVPTIVLPEDTPVEKLREYAIKDNVPYGETDWDVVANEWDTSELEGWGFEMPDWGTEHGDGESDEYDAFVEKFKPKLTTDDCYTPPAVYDAVLRWVCDTCGINPSKTRIIRPFKPGGDYLAEDYSGDCVVIDNPPFSIMSEILRNYEGMGVSFFLFAPHLTVFTNTNCTKIITGSQVEYENGAVVQTAFCSNMFGDIAVMTAPSLRLATDEAQKGEEVSLPSYNYPDEVVTASRLAQIAKYTEFRVSRAECERITALDSQKEQGRGIYGNGLLISELKAAELKAAELKAAELKAAELKERFRFDLSDREREIVKKLTKAEKIV